MSTLVLSINQPTPEYLGSRGNVGAMVLDVLCEKHEISKMRPSHVHDGKLKVAFYQEGYEGLYLYKLNSPVDDIGALAKRILEKNRETSSHLIVLHEDTDFELGKYRIKTQGGDGGHQGIKSISQAIGTDYTRIRLGIGLKGSREDYVSQPFRAEEIGMAMAMIKNAAEAVSDIAISGVDSTRREHHKRQGRVKIIPEKGTQSCVPAHTPVVSDDDEDESGQWFFAWASQIGVGIDC